MIKKSVQFSGEVLVGSVRDRPACFTVRQVTPRPGITYPTSCKRDIRKESLSA